MVSRISTDILQPLKYDKKINVDFNQIIKIYIYNYNLEDKVHNII